MLRALITNYVKFSIDFINSFFGSEQKVSFIIIFFFFRFRT